MSGFSPAVFLSYASQDEEAVARIAAALRAAGVEVWFDQDELVGGDAWDAKIRKQIAECALFVPVISAATRARREGYFRLEWRLADQRTHMMGKTVAFILPVCIDTTRDSHADVPDSFLAVQWTRLPNGETPEKFCARVKALLGVEVVRSDVGAALVGPRIEAVPEGRGRAASLQKSRRKWPVPIIITGVAAIVAVAIWQPWKKPEPTTKASVPAAAMAAEKPVVALTAAQQLFEKARKILDEGDELNRENYSLAEDLVQRAVALDPAEPLAWALYSRISFQMSWHSFDMSEARRESMRRQAERAHALAPELTEVQLAWADARIYSRQDLAGVERELLALAAREPKDWRVHRSLGGAYRYLGRNDDAIASHRRELELSGGSPSAASDLINVLNRSHRFAEAEAIKASALATHATGRLRTHDVFIRTQWRGDLVGAQAALTAWPDWLLLEDRGAILAWRTALWAKQYDKALAVAQRMSRDYLRDSFFLGPRAVLTARAHEGAGHLEAARDDWRMVVQLTERELAKSPTDAAAAYWKAWALARLGDSKQAQALALQMQQRNLLSYRASAQNPVVAVYYFQVPSAAPLWAIVGRADLALAELSGPAVVNDAPAVTRAMLELDPAFDALRSEPGFKEVLAAAPAPEPDAKTSSTPAKKDEKSVAVLAFADLSAAHDGEYFSDGISEELINVLAKIPGLKVSARTSAFYFKGTNTPIPEIAQKLGVAYVVEGSVRKAGDKVRITAQLIKATDGFHVWSDTFTRELKDVFAVQDEIAGLIAQKLSLTFTGSVTTAAPTPEALELYVQAREAWNRRNPAGFDRAEELLQRVLQLSPRFAKAHSALVDVWQMRGESNGDVGRFGQRDTAFVKKMRAKIDEALAMDPNCAEAHASAGLLGMSSWRFEEGERALRRAIELNPNYATAHQWLGRTLLFEGRLAEGMAATRRAVELDPLSSRILDNHAWSLVDAGRYEEAIGMLDRALEIRPDNYQARAIKARACQALGRSEEARALIWSIPREVNADSILAAIVAGVQKDEKWVEQFVTNPAGGTASRCMSLAAIGREADAVRQLVRDEIDVSAVGVLFFDPAAKRLREMPEFRRVMAEAGLERALARALAESSLKK